MPQLPPNHALLVWLGVPCIAFLLCRVFQRSGFKDFLRFVNTDVYFFSDFFRCSRPVFAYISIWLFYIFVGFNPDNYPNIFVRSFRYFPPIAPIVFCPPFRYFVRFFVDVLFSDIFVRFLTLFFISIFLFDSYRNISSDFFQIFSSYFSKYSIFYFYRYFHLISCNNFSSDSLPNIFVRFIPIFFIRFFRYFRLILTSNFSSDFFFWYNRPLFPILLRTIFPDIFLTKYFLEYSDFYCVLYPYLFFSYSDLPSLARIG